MNDSISRQGAIRVITAIGRNIYDLQTEPERIIYQADAVRALLSLPSAEPEQKRGWWIGKPIAGYCTVHCSVCGEVYLENSGKWNYCPNCGADMKKGDAICSEPWNDMRGEE